MRNIILGKRLILKRMSPVKSNKDKIAKPLNESTEIQTVININASILTAGCNPAELNKKAGLDRPANLISRFIKSDDQ